MASAFHTAQAASARCILLVSARSGDGKTHFSRCLQRHADVVTDEPFQVLPFSVTSTWSEPVHRDSGYLWVDGVSLLEGEGAAVLTPVVRASFDGALLVARGMVTTRAQVAECASQLRTLDMPVLGGVWNSLECPGPAETIHAFKAGLRTWPPRLPPGVFARQIRRSS